VQNAGNGVTTWDAIGKGAILTEPSCLSVAMGLEAPPAPDTTHDGADDEKHDINQVMFTVDIRASFSTRVIEHRLQHRDEIRSQAVCAVEFH